MDTRSRRGLIDAIGHGLHFLFGTATDDDVEDIQKLVENLAANQSRIFNQMAQFTTIINHTYDKIQANRDRINLITKRMTSALQDIDGQLRGLELKSHTLEKKFEFEVLVSCLEDVAHRFVRSHEAWLHRKENLEAGRLTENLLPPTILESILTSEQQPREPIHPIQWYYEHTTVIPIWTSEYLVYKTQLPVVLPARWQLHRNSAMAYATAGIPGTRSATRSCPSEYRDRRYRHHATMFWTPTMRMSAGLDQPRWHTSLYHKTVGRGANLLPPVCGYV